MNEGLHHKWLLDHMQRRLRGNHGVFGVLYDVSVYLLTYIMSGGGLCLSPCSVCVLCVVFSIDLWFCWDFWGSVVLGAC